MCGFFSNIIVFLLEKCNRFVLYWEGESKCIVRRQDESFREGRYFMMDRIRRTVRSLCPLLFFLLVYLAITDLMFVIREMFPGPVTEEQILPLTGAGAACAAVLLGAEYCRKKEGSGHRAGRKRWELFVCSVVSGIGACLFFNSLMGLLPLPEEGYRQVSQVLYRPAFFVQILCMGLLIPAAEELVFRGLGYGRMRKELSFWPAVLLSSLCFGLYHGNLAQGFYAGILGIFLAVFYEIGHSLWPCWLFHSAANTVSVVLSSISLGERIKHSPVWASGMMIAGGFLLAIVCNKIRRDGKERETVIHSDTML